MEIRRFGIQKTRFIFLFIVLCCGSCGYGKIDLNAFSENLKLHQEEVRKIYQSLDKLAVEDFSDEEVKEVVLQLRNGLLLGDQIVMKGLIMLFENKQISGRSREYVWSTLLEVLERGSSLVDFEVKHYLHRRFLTSDGETLNPTSEIYLDDLWENLSPTAGKTYLNRLSKAHQRAILLDLISRAGPEI